MAIATKERVSDDDRVQPRLELPLHRGVEEVVEAVFDQLLGSGIVLKRFHVKLNRGFGLYRKSPSESFDGFVIRLALTYLKYVCGTSVYFSCSRLN